MTMEFAGNDLWICPMETEALKHDISGRMT